MSFIKKLLYVLIIIHKCYTLSINNNEIIKHKITRVIFHKHYSRKNYKYDYTSVIL